MIYNWNDDFNLLDALAGTLVGFQQSSDYDLSLTGNLAVDGVWTDPPYKVVIAGVTLRVDGEGRVVTSTPVSAFVGRKLQMVTARMGTEGAVGKLVTRSSGSSGSGHSATAVLAAMEPRDHFAINALQAMLANAFNPHTFDDATMLMYSRAAYKWAQAMMIAAADSREGTSTEQGVQVDVNSNDLQSNTEKILFNMNESLISIKQKIGEVDDTIEDFYEVPKASGNINIKAKVFKKKYIQLIFETNMAYSDVSVYLELDVLEGTTESTRKVGYTLPKGTVEVIESLDEAVDSITRITSATVRGKRLYDHNTYAISAT